MSQERIISVLDIGPDAVLLLVAKYFSDGRIEQIHEFVAITKLCEKLLKTGVLLEEAITRTVKAAKEMQSIALKEGAQNLIVTASSVVRSAENRSKFLVKCFQSLKIYPQVLSGKEEAKFSFIGATLDVATTRPIFLVNIEEGSSEIAFGFKTSLEGAYSFDIGCFRISEILDQGAKNKGFLKSNPVLPALSHIKKELNKAYPEIEAWLKNNKPLVIVSGGVAVTYAAILKKQFVYDYKQINFTQSNLKNTVSTFKTLFKMKNEERINVPGMEIGRAEIMPAGLLSLHSILQTFNLDEYTITVNGLRMGIIKYFIER